MTELEELRIEIEANERHINALEKAIQALYDAGWKSQGNEQSMKSVSNAIDVDCALEKNFSFQEIEGGIEILGYNGPQVTALVIPNEINNKPVISIGNEAFIKFKIQKVILPRACKEIKDRAFYSCALECIEFPDSLVSLGKSVFSGCKCLKTVEFNPNLRNIGEYCFWGSGIQSLDLPPYVKAVPNGCFEWCRSLKSVSLNENLEMLGSSAFYDTAIQKIALPENIRLVEKSALDFSTQRKSKIAVLGVNTKFEGLPSNAEIYCLPGSVVFQQAEEAGVPVKKLNEYVTHIFNENDTRLLLLEKAIKVLNDIHHAEHAQNEINNYQHAMDIIGLINSTAEKEKLDAERINASLQNTKYEGAAADTQVDKVITELQASIDNNSKGVFSYRKIQDGIEILGYKGFKVDTLTIPDQINGIPVVSIGKYAFRYMSFRNVVVPKCCTVIKEGAFSWCRSLKNIELHDALIRIEKYAFYECGYIREVRLPLNVKEIQTGCFQHCRRLKTAIFNEKLETIDQLAFDGTWLEHVSLPASVKWVKGGKKSADGDFPFKNRNNSIITITVEGINTSFDGFPDNVAVYCLSESKTQQLANEMGATVYPLDALKSNLFYHKVEEGIEILRCTRIESDILCIPKVIGNKPVVGIGKAAYRDLPIVEVDMPNTIKYIGEGAFSGCSKLKKIEFPYGLERIDDDAFSGCTSLEHIILPDTLLYLGLSCFSNTSVKEVKIPKQIKHLPKCFSNCQNLKRVIINNCLRSLAIAAFKWTGLSEVIVPEEVEEINDSILSISHKSPLKLVVLGMNTKLSSTTEQFNGTIYCLPGSKAEKQAQQNGFEVRPLSEFESQ